MGNPFYANRYVLPLQVLQHLVQHLFGVAEQHPVVFFIEQRIVDTGSIRYGEEFDVQVEKKFGKHYALLFKFADYNSSNPKAFAGNVDTQKWWLQMGISF